MSLNGKRKLRLARYDGDGFQIFLMSAFLVAFTFGLLAILSLLGDK
jgi:hypothetical protein